MLRRIAQAWERCPDVPLGRLLAEACAHVEDQYIEMVDDSELLEQLETRVEHGPPKPYELSRPLSHIF